MIVVADRGLLSLDNLGELDVLAKSQQCAIDFILAVPARRYKELKETVRKITFKKGLAEGEFSNYRLVVAHDAERASARSAAHRERMKEVDALPAHYGSRLH